jgi:DNA topoisomerase-2
MFNPKEIVENVRRNIRGEDMVAMKPWCRGFTGKVVEDKKKRGVFSTFGVAEMLEHPLDSEDDTPGNLKVLIKELPIGTWTQKYKEFLEEMLVSNTTSSSDKDKKKKKTPSYLLDYNANHTDTTVSFELIFKEGVHFDIKKEDGANAPMMSAKFVKAMKLESKLNCNNMMLITPSSTSLVNKFQTPLDLITDFCKVRLDMYVCVRARSARIIIVSLTHSHHENITRTPQVQEKKGVHHERAQTRLYQTFDASKVHFGSS